MRKLLLPLVIVLIWLQYGLWFGESGHFAKVHLAEQVDQRMARVAVLERRNAVLESQVRALKSDGLLVESKARSALGLVKPGESFYLIPEGQ